MQETQVRSLGQEVPLEEGVATHSSILAWRIPWTEEPGRLQSRGSQRAGHHWSDWAPAAQSYAQMCVNMCICAHYSEHAQNNSDFKFQNFMTQNTNSINPKLQFSGISILQHIVIRWCCNSTLLVTMMTCCLHLPPPKKRKTKQMW